MSDNSPFKIRLDLLQMAKDLLMEEYYAKKEHLLEEWRESRNVSSADGKPLPIPELPTYPTELDILRKASILNDFVSKGRW